MRRIFSLLTLSLILAFGTITAFATTTNTIETPIEFEASIDWTGEVWVLLLYVNGEEFILEFDNLFALAELSKELEAVTQLLGTNSPFQIIALHCGYNECVINATRIPQQATPAYILAPAANAPTSPTSYDTCGDTIVWLSRTGTRWHTINNCGNMNPNTARSVTLEYARQNSNWQPCRVCNAPE